MQSALHTPLGQLTLVAAGYAGLVTVVALDGGVDGLDVHRRVAADAPDWLAPGGHLLIETSVAQAPATAALMTAAGLDAEVVHDEEVGGTVVIGGQQATGVGDRP